MIAHDRLEEALRCVFSFNNVLVAPNWICREPDREGDLYLFIWSLSKSVLVPSFVVHISSMVLMNGPICGSLGSWCALVI